MIYYITNRQFFEIFFKKIITAQDDCMVLIRVLNNHTIPWLLQISLQLITIIAKSIMMMVIVSINSKPIKMQSLVKLEKM